MASLVGSALVWLLSNRDLLTLLFSFAVGFGVLHTLFAIRDHYEDGGR